ncbi:exopolysaccharide biosynthesis protein, partial [Thauera sp. UPWRP]
MNGTMADAVGQSNRQRMVWLSLLAMPLLVPVALPGMASVVGAFSILIAFGLLSGQPVPLPAWLARREMNDRARMLLERMTSRVIQ